MSTARFTHSAEEESSFEIMRGYMGGSAPREKANCSTQLWALAHLQREVHPTELILVVEHTCDKCVALDLQ